MANIKERLAKDGTKRYTCDIRLKGHPPQRATFKRLTDAKKWIQDTESAIREGRHFKTVEGKKHTVSELIERYCIEYLPNNKERVYSLREQKERTQKLGWWNTKIGYLVLADVTPQIIDEHLSAMTQSNATATKYLKNLSHAFSIAVKKWGWVNENPALKVIAPQQPPGRVRFLDEDERARLLKSCQESQNKTLYPCVILALSTGMRQGELMELTWQDVNLKDGVIILQTTKNGERRRVAVAGLALELLRDHAKIRRIDTNLLFPSPTKPQQPIELKKAWLNALIRAEILDFHWHDLRHCTASYLAMNGASLTEIAEVLGHKTLSMVKRYSHLSDSHVSNVVASMNEKIFGGA